MEQVLNFLAVVINVWVFLYSCAEINKRKLNYKNKFFWLFLLIITTFVYLATSSINGVIRILVSYLLLLTACIKIFDVNIQRASITAFLSYSLMISCELVCAIFLTGVLKFDVVTLQGTFFASLAMSISISLLDCFVLSFRLIKNILSYIVDKFSKLINKTVFYFCILSFFMFIIFANFMYFDISGYLSVVMTLCLVIAYTVLTLTLFKEQSEKVQLNFEYQSILNDLSDYEKMYARERMQSHENRNDLMVIRGMTKEKNVRNYIDKLLNFSDNENDKWINQLKRIPESPLRGLLYSKLCVIDEKEIKVSFKVGNTFDSKSYLSMSLDLQAKMCKLLGIYIDNAIQAVENIDDKNIYISINRVSNKLVIKVVNNFEGKIELDRIYDKGYSTKESGHGYGLSLAKEIIDNEKNISGNTSINGNNFSQELKIKL